MVPRPANLIFEHMNFYLSLCVCVFLGASPTISEEPKLSPRPPLSQIHGYIEKGFQASTKGLRDSSLAYLLAARQLGMSSDSLHYFLAEFALSHFNYDTALVFNLSIHLPQSKPFENEVLDQRLRIYAGAGMRVKLDSVSGRLEGERKNPWKWNGLLSSGYEEQSHYHAIEYPFFQDLGGLFSKGWVFHGQSDLNKEAYWRAIPLKTGMGFDAGKAYYKDSLDFNFRVKEEFGPRTQGPTLGMELRMGRSTGIGNVFAGRMEAAYLGNYKQGFWMLQAGYETEWQTNGKKRYDVYWLTSYWEQSLPYGSLSFSIAGSKLQLVDFDLDHAVPVMYVEDISKPNPVHFEDSSFRVALQGSSAQVRFQTFSTKVGSHNVLVTSPQRIQMVAPRLSYRFPMVFDLSGEGGGRYELQDYPEPYIWEEVSLSENLKSGDYQSLAFNQKDGKYYGAIMRIENGALREYFSEQPIHLHKEHRIDQRWALFLAIRWSSSRYGKLALEGSQGNTVSNMSDLAPVWIPTWQSKIALSWTSQ